MERQHEIMRTRGNQKERGRMEGETDGERERRKRR